MQQPCAGHKCSMHASTPLPSAGTSTHGQWSPAAASRALNAISRSSMCCRPPTTTHNHISTHSPTHHCRFFEEELAEACSPLHYNIHLLAYGPLAGGTLSGKYLGGAQPEGARHTKWPGEADAARGLNLLQLLAGRPAACARCTCRQAGRQRHLATQPAGRQAGSSTRSHTYAAQHAPCTVDQV